MRARSVRRRRLLPCVGRACRTGRVYGARVATTKRATADNWIVGRHRSRFRICHTITWWPLSLSAASSAHEWSEAAAGRQGFPPSLHSWSGVVAVLAATLESFSSVPVQH